MYHPTSLIHVEDRPISHDIHHTTLFNPDFPIDNTTTPTLLSNTLLILPTPTQPLPIPPQPAPNKPTIHHTTLSHPHTSTQPSTLTPWFLLLTILLYNFDFFTHLITFNSQCTTYPFQFLNEIFQPSPVLNTPLGPHHDKLLLFNTMTSTHTDRAFSSTFPSSSTTPPTTYSTTTTPQPLHLLNHHPTHRPLLTALKQTQKTQQKKEMVSLSDTTETKRQGKTSKTKENNNRYPVH